jgi:cellulose synthase/poly-beta-1,6-N-acetylglucosamine synthase-like glycosyltransferase
MVLLTILYGLCVLWLSLYGFNSLVLTALYLRRRRVPVPVPAAPAEWPVVTVQLPVYNELHTVERLLEAAARLDYPRDRLQIQLLDDSGDETREVAVRTVARLRAWGVDVVHHVRAERAGFKAGALAAGLDTARGEIVAILDADFVPPPDFLRRMVPYLSDPTVGCAQARWGHLNRGDSPFTESQALGIDGHFVVEHTARTRNGLLSSFSGSAGLWRRRCIEEAGGWQDDTLTEDLDLSYRAQLRGWRIVSCPDVVVPGELPARVSGFRRQQARLAQGSIQTARKVLGPLLRSRLSWWVKLQGLLHLTSYSVYPLMLLLLLLALPLRFASAPFLPAAPWLALASLGPPALYLVALAADDAPRSRRWRFLPLLVLQGIGLIWGNSRAVLKGLLGVAQEFQRTPKFAQGSARGAWYGSAYAGERAAPLWEEGGLALYALAGLLVPDFSWRLAPWLLMCAGGLTYLAALERYQEHCCRRWRARQPRAAEHKPGGIPPA